MDLQLTDDQELFRDTTRRFVESTYPLTRVRAAYEAGEGVDAEYLRQGAELGWFAMLVPEEHGGGSVSGRAVADAAIVAEERGRLVQPGPFVAMNVVADAVARAGSAELQAKLLPGLLAGERVATWAVADPRGRFDPEGGVLTVPAGGGLRLTGRKSLVTDAEQADWLLVTACGEGGTPAQAIVAADAPGVRVVRRGAFDVSRHLADVVLDDVEVPAEHVLGTPDTTRAAVERQIDVAAVLTVAESVGAMAEIFGVCVQYAKDRTAFGRPIGSFQALKHLLADTSLLLEESKAVSVGATGAIQDGVPDASAIASIAKSFVAEAGVTLAQNCWQAFGGIAYTWEHDLHLYLRRLTTDAALYGDADWHRERICRCYGLGED